MAGACSPAAARSFVPPASSSPSSTQASGALTVPNLTVPPLPDTTLTVPTEQTVGDGAVLVLGDSLTVGVEPYLPALLPGRSLHFDAQVGRTTEQGLASVEAHPSELAPTVIVGLGTNDDPIASEFALAVDQMMSLLGNRQVLWVNLARKGYDSLDAVLVAASQRYPNLQLVDWATPYSQHPEVQAADGIHATEAGYRLRAEVIAAVLTSPPTIVP